MELKDSNEPLPEGFENVPPLFDGAKLAAANYCREQGCEIEILPNAENAAKADATGAA